MEKQKVGYFLPTDLVEAVEAEMKGRVKPREKWLVIAAALIRFLESPTFEKGELIGRVYAANGPEKSFKDLIEQAVAKARESDARDAERAKPARIKSRRKLDIYDPTEH